MVCYVQCLATSPVSPVSTWPLFPSPMACLTSPKWPILVERPWHAHSVVTACWNLYKMAANSVKESLLQSWSNLLCYCCLHLQGHSLQLGNNYYVNVTMWVLWFLVLLIRKKFARAILTTYQFLTLYFSIFLQCIYSRTNGKFMSVHCIMICSVTGLIWPI